MISESSEDLRLYGFPPGYFLIRSIHSNYYGKRMLLRAIESELALWVDETQSILNFKQKYDNSQVFFISEDGLLRSKSTGHPIGFKHDNPTDPRTLRAVVQPPQPFNYPTRSRCQFEYDDHTRTLSMRLPPDDKLNRDICLTRQDTDVSSISISVTSSEDCPSPTSPDILPSSPATSLGSPPSVADRPYLLEFVPRGHRQSRIAGFFDTLLESPTEEPERLSPTSPTSGPPNRNNVGRNDSWGKDREVRLVRERKNRHVSDFQTWEIIPLPSSLCEGAL